MKNHSSSPELQAVASSLLMTMSQHDNTARIIGEEGGVQDVLAAMRAYPNDPVVRTPLEFANSRAFQSNTPHDKVYRHDQKRRCNLNFVVQT